MKSEEKKQKKIIPSSDQYILSKEFGSTQGCAEVEKCIEDVRKMTLGLIKHLKNKRAVKSEE